MSKFQSPIRLPVKIANKFKRTLIGMPVWKLSYPAEVIAKYFGCLIFILNTLIGADWGLLESLAQLTQLQWPESSMSSHMNRSAQHQSSSMILASDCIGLYASKGFIHLKASTLIRLYGNSSWMNYAASDWIHLKKMKFAEKEMNGWVSDWKTYWWHAFGYWVVSIRIISPMLSYLCKIIVISCVASFKITINSDACDTKRYDAIYPEHWALRCFTKCAFSIEICLLSQTSSSSLCLVRTAFRN